MGMYDSAYIEVECPKCKRVKERECQTKDLGRDLERWHVGDYVGDTDSIICITECEDCYENFFWIRIFLEDSLLTSKYELIKTNDES